MGLPAALAAWCRVKAWGHSPGAEAARVQCSPPCTRPEHLTSFCICPQAGVQLLWVVKRSGWATGVGGDPGKRPAYLKRALPPHKHMPSNWGLVLAELPKPSPGTLRGRPAPKSGRGSRNSWSQHCTNGQKAALRGPHSLCSRLGKWPGLLGGICRPCLGDHAGQHHPCPCLLLHPLLTCTLPSCPLGGEEPQLGLGKNVSNDSC